MGFYLIGPLPPSKGGVKFVVVVVNYFTKWAKTNALVMIIAKNTMFLPKVVVCRFGIL